LLSSIINGHAETDWQRSAPAEAGGKTLQAGHSPSSLPITAPDTALSTAHLRPSHTEHHLHHCQNTEKEPVNHCYALQHTLLFKSILCPTRLHLFFQVFFF